jgi:hypothetical protein
MDNYKRYEFLDIFQEYPDGSLSPKKSIEVNGVIFNPGVVFQKGVVFGGIDFHLYKYRGIAVSTTDNSEGPLKISGFYPN